MSKSRINVEYLYVTEGGAGTGKTSVLIKDLAVYLRHYANVLNRTKQRILVISYTNNAVEVIKERLRTDEHLDSALIEHVETRTIHSLARSVLKHFKPEIAKLFLEFGIDHSGVDQQVLSQVKFERVDFQCTQDHYTNYMNKTLRYMEECYASEQQINDDEAEPTVRVNNKASKNESHKRKPNRKDKSSGNVNSRGKGVDKSESASTSTRQPAYLADQFPKRIHLEHDEVLAVFVHLLHHNSRVKNYVLTKYPLVFIDEAQDCRMFFGAELLSLYREYRNSVNLVPCQVRLYGDPRQRIYDYDDQTTQNPDQKNKSRTKPTAKNQTAQNKDDKKKSLVKKSKDFCASLLDFCKVQEVGNNLVSYGVLLVNKSEGYPEHYHTILDRNHRSSLELQDFFNQAFADFGFTKYQFSMGTPLEPTSEVVQEWNSSQHSPKMFSGRVAVLKIQSDFSQRCCLTQHWEEIQPELEKFECKEWMVLYPHKHDVLASQLPTALREGASKLVSEFDRKTYTALLSNFLKGVEFNSDRQDYLGALAAYFRDLVFPLSHASDDDFMRELLKLRYKFGVQTKRNIAKNDKFYSVDVDVERLKEFRTYFADATMQSVQLAQELKLEQPKKGGGRERRSSNNQTFAQEWLKQLVKIFPIPLSNKQIAQEQLDKAQSYLVSKLASYLPHVLTETLNQFLKYGQAISQTDVTNIHKVKGSEFENVLVVVQRRGIDFRGQSKFYYFNDLLADKKSNLGDSAKNKFNRDLNLLYVACTRARKNLLVIFVEPVGDGSVPNYSRLFEQMKNAADATMTKFAN